MPIHRRKWWNDVPFGNDKDTGGTGGTGESLALAKVVAAQCSGGSGGSGDIDALPCDDNGAGHERGQEQPQPQDQSVIDGAIHRGPEDLSDSNLCHSNDISCIVHPTPCEAIDTSDEFQCGENTSSIDWYPKTCACDARRKERINQGGIISNEEQPVVGMDGLLNTLSQRVGIAADRVHPGGAASSKIGAWIRTPGNEKWSFGLMSDPPHFYDCGLWQLVSVFQPNSVRPPEWEYSEGVQP